jgi:hypothetical protein
MNGREEEIGMEMCGKRPVYWLVDALFLGFLWIFWCLFLVKVIRVKKMIFFFLIIILTINGIH